jgi:hypothetical protein
LCTTIDVIVCINVSIAVGCGGRSRTYVVVIERLCATIDVVVCINVSIAISRGSSVIIVIGHSTSINVVVVNSLGAAIDVVVSVYVSRGNSGVIVDSTGTGIDVVYCTGRRTSAVSIN